MRALVQRVSSASVSVGGQMVGEIAAGLLVFVGIGLHDTEENARALAAKVTRLRIFDDTEGKMNLSVQQIGGDLLIISQFTLYGETQKGNRPSYSGAASPDLAERLYSFFVDEVKATGLVVKTGRFRASMQVALVNNGPITLWCET